MTKYLLLFWLRIELLQLCGTIGVRACASEDLMPSSSYVKASFEQLQTVAGYVGCELTESRQPVIIISLAKWNNTRNKVPMIHLQLQHLFSNESTMETIFVLASMQPINWQLHSDTKRHVFIGKFLVSNQSQVLNSSHVKFKTRTAFIPFGGDVQLLENWARRKWGAVTTLIYLQHSVSRIVLPVGLEPDANNTCHFQSNLPMIHAGHVEEQPLMGCFSTLNKTGHTRDIHIIELMAASFNHQSHPELLSTVDLSIHSEGSRSTKKQLILILKSHHPVKWKITTYQLKGAIDIIADQSLDISGMNTRHFRVSAERLSSLTSKELIAWAAEKFGSITSYSFTKIANKIDLSVDSKVVMEKYSIDHHDHHHDLLHNSSLIAPENRRGLRHSIIHALSLNCKENSMKISIWKYSFTNYPISLYNISLLDHSCQAVDVGAQIILSARYSECGMLHPVMRDGTVMFTNAVVVQPQSSALSLSKDTKAKLPVDAKLPIVINVSCYYLAPKNDQGAHLSNIQFAMKLFLDRDYQDELFAFPVMLHASDQLFVEIQISRNDVFNVLVRNCSLDQTDQAEMPSEKHWLIVNGCVADKTLNWINMENARSGNSLRFAFRFPSSWKPETVFHLKCGVSLCIQHPDYSIPGISQCSSGSQNCDLAKYSSQPQIAILTKGPFVVLSAEYTEPNIIKHISPSLKAETVFSATEASLDREMLHSTCTGAVVFYGVTTGAVIGISFAAFSIGVMLMSTLWYIHVCTGPKKQIGLKSSDSKGVCSKFYCS